MVASRSGACGTAACNQRMLCAALPAKDSALMSANRRRSSSSAESRISMSALACAMRARVYSRSPEGPSGCRRQALLLGSGYPLSMDAAPTETETPTRHLDAYDHATVETRWRRVWDERGDYRTQLD